MIVLLILNNNMKFNNIFTDMYVKYIIMIYGLLAKRQDGGILAKFFFAVFMDWDEVKVHKHALKHYTCRTIRMRTNNKLNPRTYMTPSWNRTQARRRASLTTATSLFLHLRWWLIYKARLLGPVVRRVDNAIHRINHYPEDKCQQNKLHVRYPLGSDLYGG